MSFLCCMLSYWSRSTLSGCLFRYLRRSSALIFLYSMVLEVVQFYLPYRTFNWWDIAANGVGILSFVVVWVVRKEAGKLIKGRIRE